MSSPRGVYPSQWIRDAIRTGSISAEPLILPDQVQPNSLDLRLGSEGWRVQCSFLPGAEGMHEKLRRFGWYPFSLLGEGVVLERNQTYIVPLCETLNLPAGIYGRANPKSTTGRLDVFTRVVTEEGAAFDSTPPGYRGRLYLEIAPRSFAIRVRAGDALSQMRFQSGDPRLTASETAQLLDTQAVVLGPTLATLRSTELPIGEGVTLSISLPRRTEGREAPTVGFQARKNTAPIDLRAAGTVSKRRYWDRIYGDSKPVILEQDEFYIFRSRELVSLPPSLCAEMVAFEASSGELRTHYAGFFDSGFGYVSGLPAEETAAAVVLEVRSRDVPFLVEDGQPLFRIHLLRCVERPDMLYGSQSGSHYQSQRDIRLSRQFTPAADAADDDEPGKQKILDL